jgi:hypothetical protein
MYPLIEAATAREHQDDLIREAAQARLGASVDQRDRRGWRVRLGHRLIRLGTRLSCGAPIAGVRVVSP